MANHRILSIISLAFHLAAPCRLPRVGAAWCCCCFVQTTNRHDDNRCDARVCVCCVPGRRANPFVAALFN
uniref:Putative secreted protein n=1 Tax=Anopheles triannulatus TaxID=58253 RepID=A0A2M4B781_9DIPT